MSDQTGHSSSSGSSNDGPGAGAGDQDSFAEVTVIDSQFQHFSSYIELIRVFKCRLCSFCSPLEHVIASHMSEVHFPHRCFLCKQCLFVFEDRAQLVSHLDSAHGTKSIAVCFGDNTPGGGRPSDREYPLPPLPLRMMMSTAEGEERIAGEMAQQPGGEETRNGRVTSSTGNLANLTASAAAAAAAAVHSSPPRPDAVEHPTAEPASILQSDEGTPPSIVNKDQNQSNPSSCHPSSSNQRYTSPEIIDCEAPQTNLEAPPTARQQSSSQPPNSELRVTIGDTYCQSYIKTEPISPARNTGQEPRAKRPYLGRSRHDPRSYMRRWSLTESTLNEGNRANGKTRMSQSFDTPGSGSALGNGGDEVEAISVDGEETGGRAVNDRCCNEMSESERVNLKKSKSLDETVIIGGIIKGDKMSDRSKSMDAQRCDPNSLGTGRTHKSGRMLDGRPPRLVRQSVVEESPRNSPQPPPVLPTDGLPSQDQTDGGNLPGGRGDQQAVRQESFGQVWNPSGNSYNHQKHSEENTGFTPTLRDLVTSSRIEHDNRQHHMAPSAAAAAAAEAPAELIQDSGVPVTSASAAWMRAGRIRSYSISEGDMQGFQKNMYPGGSLLKPAEPYLSPEQGHSPSGRCRPPPGNVPPHQMLHHCPGLVYQPYSIDGEPKHMRYYNQAPGMTGPVSADGQQHPPRGQSDENGGHFQVQGQPMEESFLYRYLRNNSGRRYRRNSVTVGNLACVDAPPSSHGPPPPRGLVTHPQGAQQVRFEKRMGLPWPRHHHPDHSFQQQVPLAPHLSPYSMVWKDKSNDSQVSPTSVVDQRQDADYQKGPPQPPPPPEGDPSSRAELVDGAHNVVVMDGKLVNATKQGQPVGGGGGGGESNQDLAKDITRQVQQAMGATQVLYTPTERHLLPWTDSNERSDSPEDLMDGDAMGNRRSRKSTFNIYREIPERKRKLDHDEEEKIKHSYNADGSFDYFTLTGWKAYKCDQCKKRRFKTASELQEHKQRKHGLERSHSSQGSLNGLPEAPPTRYVIEENDPNDSPASG